MQPNQEDWINDIDKKVLMPDPSGEMKDYSDRVSNIDVEQTVQNKVGNFSFDLDNKDGELNHIDAEDECRIYAVHNGEDYHLISGLLNSPKDSFTERGIQKEIKGRDYGRILQLTVVVEVYTNEFVKDIIEDMVAKEAPDIDTSGVEDFGVQVDKVIFANQSIWEALDELTFELEKEVLYWVDKDKVLHFEEKGTTSSGLVLKYGRDLIRSKIGDDTSDLKNFIFVYGKNHSTTAAEDFVSNGSEITFELSNKPKDTEVFNRTQGVTLSGGIEGVTDSESADYLVDFHSQEITILSGDLNNDGDEFEISYNKGNPVFAFARDVFSINNITDGQPRKKQVIIENLETENACQRFADKLIERFSMPITRGSCVIDGVLEVEAGETVRFDAPNQDYNEEELVVASKKITLNSRGYRQELELNERLGRLEDVIRDHEERLKKKEGELSGRLEEVPRIQFEDESITVSDTFIVETQDLKDSFIFTRNLIGDRHLFDQEERSDTDKGFVDGTIVSGLEYSNDSITIEDGESSGVWQVYLPYNPAGNETNSWEELIYEASENDGGIEFWIEDSDGVVLAEDLNDGADLSEVAETYRKDLVLKAEITYNSGTKPVIDSIEVGFQPSKLGDQSGDFVTHAS